MHMKAEVLMWTGMAACCMVSTMSGMGQQRSVSVIFDLNKMTTMLSEYALRLTMLDVLSAGMMVACTCPLCTCTWWVL